MGLAPAQCSNRAADQPHTRLSRLVSCHVDRVDLQSKTAMPGRGIFFSFFIPFCIGLKKAGTLQLILVLFSLFIPIILLSFFSGST
jgi:hypothetical protein